MWVRYTVILACRNKNKGETAAQQIRDEQPAGLVTLLELDVADLDSVRAFADRFRNEYDRLDLLINNAGVMMIPERQTTPQGFEMQFGTNHLGHFALTGLLIDLVVNTPGSRVVNVSSSAHRFGSMNFEDLQAQESYGPTSAYGQSKLANLLFTNELGRRLKAAGSDTISAVCHPGWTATNLQQHSRLFQLFNPLIAQDPPMGALPTLYAATALGVSSGDYYGPGGWFGIRGYPKQAQPNENSRDQTAAVKLWTVSEELTGVKYPL